jgi:hypothetical protein
MIHTLLRYSPPPSSRALRISGRLLLVALAVCTSSNLAFVGLGGNRAHADQDPVAVVAASYQAMDAAMNAGTVVRYVQAATVNPTKLLSSAQAHVSGSPAGAFLYRYDLARIQSLRSSEAQNAREYSAVTVHSTFQAIATTINGTQATVTGNESFFLDETIQNDGLVHRFCAAKQAAMVELHRTGKLIEFGQTNHSTALI